VFDADELQSPIAEAISLLWGNNQIKKFFATHQDINLPTCSDYYFDSAIRYSEKNFRPTSDDIVRAKLKTSGIVEIGFAVRGQTFSLVDVGGQRSERRKWIHAFDGVTAVIFLVALDEYNKTLEEDANVNRMEESLALFMEMSSSTYVGDKPFLVFLNKCDIFKEKIKTYPLHQYRQDVPPDVGSDYEKSVDYVKQQYQRIFRGKEVFFFVTCAIDTTNCQRIFDAAQNIVVGASLEDAGFL